MLLAFLLLISSSVNADNSLLIRSATVIDGLGGPAQSETDIEVINGRITRIGPRLKSKVANVIDAHGMFVTPGLIDAHTHLHSVPGGVYRHDEGHSLNEQRDHALKAYLAAGVTTVLDCAASEALLLEAKEQRDAPRILGLAPFLTPVGGYFASEEARGVQYADLWAPVRDTGMIKEHFDRAKPMQSLGAKVTMEKGFGPVDSWPVFDEKMRTAIVEESRRTGIPLFVHSMSEEEHRLALTMRPYTLVHAGFYEKVPGPEMLAQIKESGAFVITTLAIYKMTQLMWNKEALNDAWLRSLVPPEQLEAAMNKEASDWVIHEVVRQSKPKWLPEFVAKMIARFLFNEAIANEHMRTSQRSVRLMYEAGIPLVMGSDAGNWPIWTTFFHGVGSILEMEALEEAGLPREEILVAATSRAARMMKIDGETGSIQAGKAADLVILGGNPLESMKAFRDIRFVIQGGRARMPKLILSGARGRNG